MGIQVAIAAKIEEEGIVAIPGKQFAELIATLTQKTVIIYTKNTSLEVQADKLRSAFPTMSHEEFPRLYQEKGEIVIRAHEDILQKEFSRVAFAASVDAGRPALSGVLLNEEEEHIVVVATDGYRLSLGHLNVFSQKEKRDDTQKPYLVPARLIRQAILLKGENGEILVRFSRENNQVLFEEKDIVLVGRLIDAEFPAYQKILPTDVGSSFLFEREEMQKAVKICAIFAREAANIVRFSLKKNNLTVSANTPSVGENTVEIDGKLTGEENDIAFNARYLLDLLSNITETELVFEMTGPLNPGVFKIKDNPSFLHLIMPIRVQA